MSEKYYYRVISCVRDKAEQFEEGLEVLNEEHDTLGDEFREIICDDSEDWILLRILRETKSSLVGGAATEPSDR